MPNSLSLFSQNDLELFTFWKNALQFLTLLLSGSFIKKVFDRASLFLHVTYRLTYNILILNYKISKIMYLIQINQSIKYKLPSIVTVLNSMLPCLLIPFREFSSTVQCRNFYSKGIPSIYIDINYVEYLLLWYKIDYDQLIIYPLRHLRLSTTTEIF